MTIKTFFILCSIFLSNNLFSQYKFFEVKLKIEFEDSNKHKPIELDVYSQDSNYYVRVISSYCDSIYVITENEFDNVAKLTEELSSKEIFKGINISNPLIVSHGDIYELKYGFGLNKIIFNVWNPFSETNERNLNDFVKLCKEIVSHSSFSKKLPCDLRSKK